MSNHLRAAMLAAMLAGCSGGADEGGDAGDHLDGPYPKRIEGTIGYSYPLEDGSGRILLGLLEHDDAVIIVGADTWDAKGMQEEDAEVALDIEPMTGAECGDAAQCFRGF